jgi:plastocyanin
MTTRARTVSIAVAALATVGVIAGCGGSSSSGKAPSKPGSAPSAPRGSSVVTLKNLAFHPAVVHIKVGQSVTWEWEDADIDTQHNVTSTGPGSFTSSPTKLSGIYTVTFPKAGTYDFQCTIHPASMNGKVIVQ